MFRRSKIPFASEKDDRVKFLNQRVNLAEKHLAIICTAFASYARKMARFRDSHDDMAKCFKNYVDEEDLNESLAEGLKNFFTAITVLGDYIDGALHCLENKVLTQIFQFENVCKMTREKLRNAVNARNREVDKQRQMLELKNKFAANNTAADAELMKAKQEVHRTNKEINEILYDFEKQKLKEVKTSLLDFVYISMKYHTKAIETLTASFYDLNNIDVHGDHLALQNLIRKKEKSILLKSSKSQSLDQLDRDSSPSPLNQSKRLSTSNKTLNTIDYDKDRLTKDDYDDEDEDEDIDEEDDDVDEDESTEDNSSSQRQKGYETGSEDLSKSDADVKTTENLTESKTLGAFKKVDSSFLAETNSDNDFDQSKYPFRRRQNTRNLFKTAAATTPKVRLRKHPRELSHTNQK
ncbi:protein FAM92A [Teleopsis dalmanni]|uniref:protein FAM92A n=1 Tax=Teleopsis dalmanni TaxID=139649 RepID=UPI0018CFB9AA|nr:protein FAM92A [Teleopsis dalmanni]